MARLTTRQQAFVQAYLGPAGFDPIKAYVMAGGLEDRAHAGARKLMRNKRVLDAIGRELQEGDVLQSTLEERYRFYTDIMRDKSAAMRDRLKAAELLGKLHGDVVDKTQVDLNVKTEDPLTLLMKSQMAKKKKKDG